MGNLSKIIFSNLYYKISAVLLALIFWYFVQGEEVLEINRKVQVILEPTKGYIVKGGNIRYKDVTLKGPRALLGNFSSRPLKAKIKISTNSPGEIRYRIDKQYLYNWDNRIKLTVHDAYMTVFVDEQLTKRIPIKEYLLGVPADGYIIEKTTISPNNIMITGLKSDLKLLQQVNTEAIDISGIQKSRQFEASLKTKGLEASLSTETVKIKLQIGEKKINKRYDGIPIEIKNYKAYSVAVHPLHVSIIIQGTPSAFKVINKGDLRAFIDILDLEVGKFSKNVQVQIPANTVLIETNPIYAEIFIKNKKKANHK